MPQSDGPLLSLTCFELRLGAVLAGPIPGGERELDGDLVVPDDRALRLPRAVALELDEVQVGEFFEVPMDLPDVALNETRRLANALGTLGGKHAQQFNVVRL